MAIEVEVNWAGAVNIAAVEAIGNAIYVPNTGNTTIGGIKTFPSAPILVAGFVVGATLVNTSGAELNHVVGVTSGIQAQLNAKSPLISPNFTTPNIGVASGTSLALSGNLSAAASTFIGNLIASPSGVETLKVDADGAYFARNGSWIGLSGLVNYLGGTTLFRSVASGSPTVSINGTTGVMSAGDTTLIKLSLGGSIGERVILYDGGGGSNNYGLGIAGGDLQVFGSVSSQVSLRIGGYNGTTVLVANSSGITVTGAGTFSGAVSFATGPWNISAEGVQRFAFVGNSTSYWKGAGSVPHIWRSNADVDLMTLGSSGDLVTIGNLFASAGTFTGNLSAVAGTFSGAITTSTLLSFTGYTTALLPLAASNARAITYNLTLAKHVGCDGSTWSALY